MNMNASLDQIIDSYLCNADLSGGERPEQMADALLAVMPWTGDDYSVDTIRAELIDTIEHRQANPIIEQAKADGAEAVDTYYNEDLDDLATEEQIAKLQATIAPGHLSWDEAAINAGAYQLSCSELEGYSEDQTTRDLYYRTYDAAARSAVEQLIANLEAETV